MAKVNLMTNTERLFQHTLPRWSGVTVIEIDEVLGDMWIRGEKAAHHAGVPFDPDAVELLRKELRRDFTGAPSQQALGAGGAVQSVADLDDEMQRFDQKPMGPKGALMKTILSKDEFKKWTERADEREND